jgi:hypothetical protein
VRVDAQRHAAVIQGLAEDDGLDLRPWEGMQTCAA